MNLQILIWWNHDARRGMIMNTSGRATGIHIGQLTLLLAEYLVARHSDEFNGMLVDVTGREVMGTTGKFTAVDSVDLPLESDCFQLNGSPTPESKQLWEVYQQNLIEQAAKKRNLVRLA